MNRIGRVIEQIVINTRWLIVPFLLGLIVGLIALLYAFFLKLGAFVLHVRGAPEEEIFVGVLKLIDFALTANLLLIVISAGYQNFVARITPREKPNWPDGLTGIGFGGLKQKLLGSIAAIAAVNVLEWFMDIERSADNVKLAWVVGILLAFTLAMLILAIADRISEPPEEKNSE
ncbi:MAG: YqhA family protein [Bradyrhizobium sp.]|nr:YqhA family protein [Bradyrhizobium sp.]